MTCTLLLKVANRDGNLLSNGRHQITPCSPRGDKRVPDAEMKKADVARSPELVNKRRRLTLRPAPGNNRDAVRFVIRKLGSVLAREVRQQSSTLLSPL